MARGKRISVVVHYEGIGGAARSLPLRLRELAPEAELEFLVPGPGLAAEELQGLGAVHELSFGALTFPDSYGRAPGHLYRLARQVRVFGRHFEETRPDLVLTSSMMVPSAVLAARRRRIPVLVHCSVLLNSERLPSSPKRMAGRILINRTSAWSSSVVACSEGVADQFRSSRKGVEVIYPPIGDFDGAGDGRRLRRQFGIGAGVPCVAMVGNISRGRGQDVLVRAMVDVRRRLTGARCLIVGAPFNRPRDLAYRDRLANLVRGSGLEQTVVFTGPLEEIADVYAAADVVVNPARVPESFGRVACEALSAGKPVVSTRVGAVEEVLEHGRNALLVEPEQPSALADAIVASIQDSAAAEARVEAGQAEVRARFSPEPLAARFREIIEETLGPHPQGGPSGEPQAPAPRQPPTAGAHA